MALVRGDDAEWERPEETDKFEWFKESICDVSLIVSATMCSGIAAPEHAATNEGLATRWLGGSEIGSPQSEFLRRKFDWSHNAGDMTSDDFVDRFRKAAGGRIDVLIGGTPCQSFSRAGKRLGHADPRGRLLSIFARHVRELKPAVAILENVDGLRSVPDNSFGLFLAAALGAAAVPMMPTGENWPRCGIAASPDTEVAWRMLDAQFFGLPQHRERLYAAITRRDSGISATDIVFDGAARRPFRKIDFARTCSLWLPHVKSVWAGCGTEPPGFDAAKTPFIGDFLDPAPDPELRPAVKGTRGVAVRAWRDAKKLPWPLAAALADFLADIPDDDTEGRAAVDWLAARRSEGPDEGQPSGPVVCSVKGGSGPAPTLTTRSLVALNWSTPFVVTVDPCVSTRRLLRRLSPAECLRLQGFDPGWLDAYPEMSKTAKYVAVGNSMAIPCVRLMIARAVDAILRARKEKLGWDWDSDCYRDDWEEDQEWEK